MIDLSNVPNIYILTQKIDFRKGIDGLVSLIENSAQLCVLDGSLFIFCRRDCRCIKIIQYENGGFWLYMKRLDKDKFQWDKNSCVKMINQRQFRWLLEGLTMFPKRSIDGENKPKITC